MKLINFKNMDWISVKDETPQREVLAINLSGDYLIGYVAEGKKMFRETKTGFICENETELLENVSHWMPLPNPPIK